MTRSNPRIDEQLAHNRATRDAWDRFQPHRRHVTQLALQQPGGRLCVLGAGNCNDLDLAQLVPQFDEVHLVDLDASALRQAIQRQGPGQAAERCRIHAPVDLSGMLDVLAREGPSVEPDAVLARAASAPPPELPGPFDQLLSTNLLTQLFDSALRWRGVADDLLARLLLTLRQRHLALMLEQLTLGGRGLLVTDVVSSQTCPELETLDDALLPSRLAAWIAAGNFFTGANPAAIARQLQQLGAVAVQLHAPWRWNLGPRWYAVAAISFQR